MKGIIFSIEEFAIYDGPGIRANVFFKGCPLRCRWCHNPEGLSPKIEIAHSPNGCLACGKCRSVCTSPQSCKLCGECIKVCPRGLVSFMGQEWDSDKLTERIMRLKPILSNGGGVTYSGGEVLMQADFLVEMLDKTSSLHRAIETSGFGKTMDFERALSRVELVYFDLKHMDPQIHEHYTGVTNDLILQNAKVLMNSGVEHVFRVPFIHGVNTSEQNLTALAEFLSRSPQKETVEFLMYNKMAGAKYPLMGKTYQETFEQPYPQEVELAEKLLADFNVSFRK